MYKAVILDFDGTIFDSYGHSFKRIEEIAWKDGLVITPERKAYMLRIWGQTGVAFLQNVFLIDEERATRLYMQWERMDLYDPAPFIKGTHQTLEWLRKKNVAICMLTSRRLKTLLPLLRDSALHGHFAYISAHENNSFHKPDRRAFADIFLALKARNITVSECIFVGDTSTDIEAGRNAGVRTLVVETGPYREAYQQTHPVAETVSYTHLTLPTIYSV